MRLRVKQIGIAIILLFVVIQFVPVDKQNPSQTIYATQTVPPEVRNVTLTDCGHIPMWDDPETVADALLAGSAIAAGVR